jgi:hypothetical protein
MSTTLEDLVLRYEDDVQSRIETLEGDKAELFGQLHNGDDVDFYRDLNDQIAHWKATLGDIQEVIDRENLR